jgi:hypothetical protein
MKLPISPSHVNVGLGGGLHLAMAAVLQIPEQNTFATVLLFKIFYCGKIHMT